MSKLAGHYSITQMALEQLASECKTHSVVQGVPLGTMKYGFPSEAFMKSGGLTRRVNLPSVESPAWGAVVRDVSDVLNGGHWAEFAQKRHFMRRNKQQPMSTAYDEAVEWIRNNALEAAKELQKRIRLKFEERRGSFPTTALQPSGDAQCALLPDPELADLSPSAKSPLKHENLFVYRPSLFLGNAVHALQDSFSESHTRRAGSEDRNYEIEYIYLYADEEAESHDEFDHQWRKELSCVKGKDGHLKREYSNSEFSETGELAVGATKRLIEIVINSALSDLSAPLNNLLGFEEFQSVWLAISKTINWNEPLLEDRKASLTCH